MPADDDVLVMYIIVPKDVPLGLGEAMAAAGGAAVRCFDRLAADERFAGAFAAWRSRPRKVALRAGADELALVVAEEPCAVAGELLACLPPRRKSERSALLESLRAYTDGPRGSGPPELLPDGATAMRYLIREGVIKTTGKAMAQAGHAALACVWEHEATHPEAFAAWRRDGYRGEVDVVDEPGEWARLRESRDAVVVQDAGLTQVQPGTETVIALVPGRV